VCVCVCARVCIRKHASSKALIGKYPKATHYSTHTLAMVAQPTPGAVGSPVLSSQVCSISRPIGYCREHIKLSSYIRLNQQQR